MTQEVQNLKSILENLQNAPDIPDKYKSIIEADLTQLNTLTEDEQLKDWVNDVLQDLYSMRNEIDYDKQSNGITYDEYIKGTREGFHWHDHANFETMSLEKMFKIFKEYKEKAPFEKMVEVIPFKDSIAYMDDVCYMFASIFNWEDIPEDYDVTLDTKANDFLRKMYPYTKDFTFISIKSIKNFVNVYHKIMDIDRKRELCNKMINKLIRTEGDLKNYQKSYNILRQVNKEGIEDLIKKYKFMASIDDRPIEDMIPEDL